MPPMPRWPAVAESTAPSIGPRARPSCVQPAPPLAAATLATPKPPSALPCRPVDHPYRRAGVAGWTSGEAELLASCYRRCLAVADELARSVAFPAISTGIYGYPRPGRGGSRYNAASRRHRGRAGSPSRLRRGDVGAVSRRPGVMGIRSTARGTLHPLDSTREGLCTRRTPYPRAAGQPSSGPPVDSSARLRTRSIGHGCLRDSTQFPTEQPLTLGHLLSRARCEQTRSGVDSGR